MTKVITSLPASFVPGSAEHVQAGRMQRHAMNAYILRRIKAIELIGVVMRIVSFSTVSWMGPESPFMLIWIFNTIDAVMLSWCAVVRRDLAYSLLNIFWIGVGVVGIIRAMPAAH